MTEFRYQNGFANFFATEAEPGALPKKGNNPQKCPLGLYAEQLSGAAFTAPPQENLRSWLYRIRPAVVHSPNRKLPSSGWESPPLSDESLTFDQMRWDPLPYPDAPTPFCDSWHTIAATGDVQARSGSAVHLFAATADMEKVAMQNADGETLILPQQGALHIQTEMGWLAVEPQEVLVIPRGIRFRVLLPEGRGRGYICENFGSPFTLPGRGPIGANGLAHERDFLAPVAAYQDRGEAFRLRTRFQGHNWECDVPHCPFDVVAWHGNYYPYKYDLRLFNTINTVSFDHPDPSIFTVLTSPTTQAGTANVDFVIFPPRWVVAEDTFRPPYYHRNVMSEYMGLIHGIYDAKPGGGFVPGGGSLHHCMSAHGPDAEAFQAASTTSLEPVYQGDTLAFMFESSLVYRPTRFGVTSPIRQKDYLDCWQGLRSHFSAPSP